MRCVPTIDNWGGTSGLYKANAGWLTLPYIKFLVSRPYKSQSISYRATDNSPHLLYEDPAPQISLPT